MRVQSNIQVVVAFLPDRVFYSVERNGDVLSSSGVMRPSPESLSGRGLKFEFASVTLAPDVDLQPRLLRGSLDLQTSLEPTPNFFDDEADPAIVRFLQDLMDSVFQSVGETKIKMSSVNVALAN